MPLVQPLGQLFHVEEIDAHVGQRALVSRLRLLVELDDAPRFVGGHNAETIALLQGHVHHRHGQVGAFLFVIGDHGPVIHLVDVVAGENKGQVGLALAQVTQILVDGIGGAVIPVLGGAGLVGLEQAHAAAQAVQVPGLADANVLVERMGTVLGQDGHVVDVRIDAVGKREINDTVFAGERHRGLGPLVREHAQAGARPAGHDHGHDTHKRTSKSAKKQGAIGECASCESGNDYSARW